jgi:uncharacterized membrane protein YfcA
MVFGSAMTNFLIFSLHTHPHMNRPLIDYDLVLVSEPMIKIGTSIGVILNIVFPNWLTLILLVVVLAVSGIQTTKKGYDLVKAARRATYGVSDSEAPETFPPEASLLLKKTNFATTGPLKQIQWWESLRAPLHKWLVVIFTWSILLTATLLRGSKAHPSVIGILQCGMWWWLILLFSNLALLLVAYGYALYLRWYHYYKTKHLYVYHGGDIKYTTKKALFLPIPFLVVGVVSSMIGNGGGIILSPMFLQLGVLHQVVAATVALLEVCSNFF